MFQFAHRAIFQVPEPKLPEMPDIALMPIIIKSRQPRGFADLIQMVIGCQVLRYMHETLRGR